ncbi:MAG: DUF4405 domain-containing protein [Sedimentisphaerales bacterium]|nr:DUF4405 domain-containing protein [Sedimentisphaerales bacterium]
MKRAQLNLVIDAVLLLCFSAIVGIGLLMKYVLVPGYLRYEIYGQNVDLFLWGIDRHQWGTIHFIIGLVFAALLVMHIILHWAVIVSIYRRMIPNRFARWLIALILLVVTILLFALAYFIKPKVIEQGKGKGLGWGLGPCGAKCGSRCDIEKWSIEKS